MRKLTALVAGAMLIMPAFADGIPDDGGATDTMTIDVVAVINDYVDIQWDDGQIDVGELVPNHAAVTGSEGIGYVVNCDASITLGAVSHDDGVAITAKLQQHTGSEWADVAAVDIDIANGDTGTDPRSRVALTDGGTPASGDAQLQVSVSCDETAAVGTSSSVGTVVVDIAPAT